MPDRVVVNGVQEGSSVVFYGRDAGGAVTRHRERAEFCFFLRGEDVTEALRRELRSESHVVSFVDEGAWVRVSCVDWVGRNEIVLRYEKQGRKTYEGDVNPVKRLLADRGDLIIGRPRRCYLDLETDSRVPFGRKEEARILVWALTDDEGDTAAGWLEEDTDQDERALLQELIAAMEPYDQVCVWSGNRTAADIFDEVMLKARAKHCRINVDLRRWLVLSQLDTFKRMNLHSAESGDEKQSFKLDNIAHILLGVGKHEFDASKTWEAWAAGGAERERLVAYCIQDVELLPRIEAKRSYLGLHQVVCEMCRIFPDSWGLMPTAFVDGFMFKLGRERGVHFGSKLHREREEGQFEGALRGEVPLGCGLIRDVHVVDFASLYPSIIKTFNMSPETRAMGAPNGPVPAGMCRAPKTGACFSLEREGLLASAVGTVMALRKEWKRKAAAAVPGSPEEKRAEQIISALKVINNSFFGVASSQGSRIGDQSIGAAITGTGQWAIGRVVEEAERRGYKVISVDTDGAMMTGATREGMRELVRAINQDILPPLIAAMGCPENHFELDYQEEFSRLVFVGTGKYIASFAHRKGKEWHPKMRPEVKGMEYVRGDSLKLARNLQGEIIDMLCAGLGLASCPVPTDDIALYVGAVERHRRHALEDALTVDEVKVSKRLSKELHQYAKKKKNDGTEALQPIQVRVGQMLKARGMDAREGTKIEFVYVDGQSEPKNIVPACDYDGTVDRAYLWDHLVWPATERLLQAAYPGEDWERFRAPRERAVRARKVKPSEGQAGLFG